ncbi:hypothetical protein [Clostridium sp. AN503]
MKNILKYCTLIFLLSAISFPAYGGTWLRYGVNYTFTAGSRGTVVQ